MRIKTIAEAIKKTNRTEIEEIISFLYPDSDQDLLIKNEITDAIKELSMEERHPLFEIIEVHSKHLSMQDFWEFNIGDKVQFTHENSQINGEVVAKREHIYRIWVSVPDINGEPKEWYLHPEDLTFQQPGSEASPATTTKE